ncbi:DUF1279 super [Collariella sp. IMI 366227]|nr:DUF1279 super [Collariella sp. IMI 366227]
MLRTAFGAFDALLGGSAVQGTIVRNIVARGAWIGRAANKGLAAPWQQRALMSQLNTSRTAATRSRFTRPNAQFYKLRRPFHFTRPRRAEAPKNGKPVVEESLSLSQRLKKLSREYGWTAVGIYFALSVLDFPFCFLLVRTVGTEKIAHLEEIVVSHAQRVIPEGVQNWWHDFRQRFQTSKQEGELEVVGHGVEEASQRSKQEGASLATQLALAYAIHKSFIFLRVPLTAAVTPRVVKVLRGWGWEIGKRTPKH